MLIAQITDSHIVAEGKHWLSEPLTQIHQRLARVISRINTLTQRPDVIVMTGDATEDGAEESYRYFKELLKPLEIPIYIIPGNHDRRELMRKAFSDSSYMPSNGYIQYAIENHAVRLIGLDTLVEGEDFGCICGERFDWLEKTFDQEREKPTLIFMHHPPVKVGVRLFDQMTCKVPEGFEGLVRKRHNLIGLIAGHYHHLCVSTYAGKPCFLAPSIAPVHIFAHPQDDHVTALELEEPCITLHHWQGGSIMTSHVIRVKETTQRLDWETLKRNHS